MDELPIPPAVLSSKRAMEMARIWVVDGGQVVTLSSNLWDDPGTWGLMLVDLARHVARAYEQQGWSRDKVLEKVREAMNAEWSHPTDAP